MAKDSKEKLIKKILDRFPAIEMSPSAPGEPLDNSSSMAKARGLMFQTIEELIAGKLNPTEAHRRSQEVNRLIRKVRRLRDLEDLPAATVGFTVDSNRMRSVKSHKTRKGCGLSI